MEQLVQRVASCLRKRGEGREKREGRQKEREGVMEIKGVGRQRGEVRVEEQRIFKGQELVRREAEGEEREDQRVY